MSLYIKPEDRLIYLRKGDSGVVKFEFENDMTGVTVTFAVKKDKSDKDDDAVIIKSFLFGSDPYLPPNVVLFLLTSEDTSSLEVEPLKSKQDYQDYVWTLKIETERGILADTLIPSGTDKFPKFRLYYGSVPDLSGDAYDRV